MKLLLPLLLITASFANAQNVNIPDANFKAYLVGEPSINTNGDTEIQVTEANAYTGTIECNGMNIADLTGIEEFTALTGLNCFYNQLTSLDLSNNSALTELSCYESQLISLEVSQNTALTFLNCGFNQLTSLDVSQNTGLTGFWCGGNQLTSLDVSQNTGLTGLICDFNQLTSLDVSQNSALTTLWCYNNQLTSLDVSQNTALTELKCNGNQLNCLNVKNGNNFNIPTFEANGNPSLTCIEVDDAAWSTANWMFIDPQTSFSTNCNNACSNVAVGISELSAQDKELIKIANLLGQETEYKPNTPLIYIYSDGSTEKVYNVE